MSQQQLSSEHFTFRAACKVISAIFINLWPFRQLHNKLDSNIVTINFILKRKILNYHLIYIVFIHLQRKQ